MQEKLYQKIQLMTQLSAEELKQFLQLARPGLIPKGTLLTKPHQPVQDAYFLKQGILRHYILGRQRKEFTKNFIRGPRFALPSLSDFFNQSPSSIYCEALTDLEVLNWKYPQIIEFADAHPRFYKFLLKGTVGAFKRKEQKEIALNQKSAEERYLDFLEEFPLLVNQVPLQYIASYLNIRPETLSRIRARLRS